MQKERKAQACASYRLSRPCGVACVCARCSSRTAACCCPLAAPRRWTGGGRTGWSTPWSWVCSCGTGPGRHHGDGGGEGCPVAPRAPQREEGKRGRHQSQGPCWPWKPLLPAVQWRYLVRRVTMAKAPTLAWARGSAWRTTKVAWRRGRGGSSPAGEGSTRSQRPRCLRHCCCPEPPCPARCHQRGCWRWRRSYSTRWGGGRQPPFRTPPPPLAGLCSQCSRRPSPLRYLMSACSAVSGESTENEAVFINSIGFNKRLALPKLTFQATTILQCSIFKL